MIDLALCQRSKLGCHWAAGRRRARRAAPGVSRATRFAVAALAALASLAAVHPVARACPYSLRDSAFIAERSDDEYQLYLVADADAQDAPPWSSWLEAARAIWLGDTNVDVQFVDANGPAPHRLSEALGGSLPAELRDADGTLHAAAAIVVGPDGRAATLQRIAPEDASPERVMDLVAGLVDSPLRRQLEEQLPTAWCVVLLVDGSDPAENQRAAAAVAAAGERITGSITEMDKVVSIGPVVVRQSRDDPRERLVLWSLGLDIAGLDVAATASDAADAQVTAIVLTGRGERRGPALIGPALTEPAMFEIFEMLGRSCTCTTADIWLAGTRVPLRWTGEMDELAAIELGFDPRAPETNEVLEAALRGASALAGGGYREVYFDDPQPADRGSAPPAAGRGNAGEPGDAVEAGQTAEASDASTRSSGSLAVAAVPSGALGTSGSDITPAGASPAAPDGGGHDATGRGHSSSYDPREHAAAGDSRGQSTAGLTTLALLLVAAVGVLAVATVVVLRRRPAV